MIVRLLLLLACAVFIHGTASHLHVELKSTWIDTPKIAEIAEFLVHRTNSSLYWTFIERVVEVEDDLGLDLAKDILDESTLSLLKMSLDIRYLLSFFANNLVSILHVYNYKSRKQ